MSPRVRWWLVRAAMGYLALLALLVLWPNGEEVGRLNIDLYLFFLHRGVSPSITPGFYAFALNILIFVLPVLVAALLVERIPASWWAVAGGLFSLLVELTQGLLLPGRVPSGKDVVANSIGAALGAATAAVLRSRLGHTASAIDPTDTTSVSR